MELTQRINQRLRELEDWTAVIDELEAEIAQIADKSEQSHALFELARACEEVFLNRARAMTCYQQAFKLDQANLQALARARKIYQDMAHLEMVARLMGLELQRNTDPNLLPALSYDYGTALLNQGKIDAARPFLEQAQSLAPNNELHAERFQEILYDRNNWRLGLDTVLTQLRALTSADDPLGVEVVNRGRMLSALYLRAARILQQESPDDPRLLPFLFKAIDADPNNDEAAFIAETLLAAGGHLQHIQQLQDRAVAHTADPSERLRLLLKAASVWQVRLNNAEMADYFYHQALDLALEHGLVGGGAGGGWLPGAFRRLALTADGSANADSLIPLAERAIAVLGDPGATVIALAAGELAWRKFNDVATARRFFSRAVSLAPTYPTLVEFVRQEGELSPESVDDGTVVAPREDQPTRKVTVDESGPELAATASGRAYDAPSPAPEDSGSAQQVPEAEADIASPTAAVDDAANDQGPLSVAAEVAAPSAEPEAQQASAPTAAEVQAVPETPDEPAPDDASASAADFEGPGHAAPSDEDESQPQSEAETATSDEGDERAGEVFSPDQMALIRAAEAAEASGGRRALELWRDAVSAMPEKQFPRARLRDIYAGQSKWSNVADLVKDQLKFVDEADISAREAIYWDLVEIYRDRLRQPGLVVTTLAALEKILEDAGYTDELLRVLEVQQEHFEALKRWSDVVTRLRRRAELSPDAGQQKALHLEAAALFLDRFNNQAEAIKSFEAVLEIDPTESTAIDRLKELYERRRDWERMIAVQQKQLSLIEDPEARREALLEVARNAAQKLKKPSLSIELWSQLLELEPGNQEALQSLETLHEREKAWPELAQVLDQLITFTSDPATLAGYLTKLAQLYTDKIPDPAAAITTWERLYELEADNRRAQDALKKLYIQEGRMDDLERFYAQQDKWAEFVRVLEREADSASGSAQIDLQVKIADLYRDRLAKPDRAIRALEKALGQDEHNLVVAQRLLALYEEAGDERNLSRPLVIKLEHCSDPAEQQQLLRRLGDLSERVHGDAVAAFDYYRQAFTADYQDEQLRAHLLRLGAQTGAWADVAHALAGAISKLDDEPEISVELRLELAEIQEHKLVDLDAALRLNQEILELDPENATALASLERLYLALGREKDLLDVLDTKLSLAQVASERREIQLRIGGIHEQLGHYDDAIRRYEAVLAMGVEDPQVLAALDRIYAALSRYDELADVLSRQVAAHDRGDVDGLCALMLRLACLKRDQLNLPEQAIGLFQQVLELRADNESAREHLERWLDEPAHALAVAGVLLPVYEADERWDAVIRCLELQAQAAQETDSHVELLLRIGNIAVLRMGDANAGFGAYSRALRADPLSEIAQVELENLAPLEGRWQDLTVLYEEAVQGDLPTARQRALLLKLAELYDTQLDEPGKAIAAYQRVLDLDPGDSAALNALVDLHSRGQQWTELLDMYRRKVENEADPSSREELRFRIATLQEDMLGAPEDAIVTYTEILADDDTNMRAIAALDRLYTAGNKWPELAENLARQLALVYDETRQIEVSLRLGEVRLHRLGQPALAIETYARVLDLDPQNATAVAALEQLLDDQDHQLAVAKLLESVFRTRNDWSRLVQLYEIMVKHSLEPGEKIALLLQIGELYEIGGEDVAAAFAAYGRALREDAANLDTQQKLESLARQLGSYEQLVELYEGVVDQLVNDELRIALLAKVAQMYEAAIDAPQRAAAIYEKILSIDPTHFAAIDALIDVYQRGGDFPGLVAAVVRKAEMLDDPDGRKQLLLYAAGVRETVMDDPQGAIDLYRRVLTVDDADLTALNALVKLLIQLERWDELKDVYQRLSELATDPAERRQALYVLGQVYDVELGDVDRAIDTYQAVLDIDPSDEQAMAALDRLYGQAERWLDQLQILERAVAVAGTTQEEIAYRFRIGNLWSERLGDKLRAVESYREVLAQDPGHGPAIEALERIAQGSDEPMVAAQVLAPLYEQLAEWDRLVAVEEVLVRCTEDPGAKIERLHHLAGVYERQLGNLDQAFAAYARALALDPQLDTTIAHLERLAEVTEQWARYAELLGTQVDSVVDADVQTSLLLRLAHIYEAKLRDNQAAIDRWMAVIAINPENLDAVFALDRMFTTLERWPELVENLARQLAITVDESSMIELNFRIGQVQQQQLGAYGKAIAAYREVLNLDPSHAPTLEALEAILAADTHQSEIAEILEPIYFASERWDALIRLGDIRLSLTEDEADRRQIITQVADICEHRLGDLDNAYVWWLRGYMDDPLNEHTCAEMERLAELTQDWAYVVEAGQQILEAGPSPEVRVAVLLRSAAVLERHVGDLAGATDAYRQVLDIDPEHNGALAALDRIYDTSGMPGQLAEILQRRIRAAVDGSTLIDLEVRLAQVFEASPGNLEQAVAAYHRALEHDPRHHGALERLEHIYLAQHRWGELFDVYQRMADAAATDEDMANAYQRMAKLASDTLDREADSVDLWNRVLDLRGDDPLALGELAALHQRAERWAELVDILQRQVLVLDEPTAQVRAYQTLAVVYGQHLDRQRDALEAWLSALDADPNDLDTLQALHKIYRDTQSWIELVDILERLLSRGAATLDIQYRRDLYAELGRVQASHLMAADAAEAAWQHVLELDPADLEALRALEDIYTEQGRWEDAIAVLERKAKIVTEEDERLDVLMQVGALWGDRVANYVEAAGVYQEVLETDPKHLGASEALEHIYRDTADWDSLAALLINRAEVLEQRDMRVATLQAAAEVFEQNLNDVDMAFATLQAAFNVDYANDHTSRELERLATAAGKWGELLNEYNGLVEQLEDIQERCELWVKIGRWYGEHLQRPDYGVSSLEKALALNPESVSALRELASFQRRGGDWGELVHTLARIVPLEHDPAAQGELLSEQAAVYETQLGDLAAATEAYRRVLELDSSSVAALDSLARLYERQQLWTDLVATLERRAGLAEDPDLRLNLRKHAAYVQEVNLADVSGAIETLRGIVADEPSDLDALHGLERLFFQGGRATDYLEILEAQLDVTNEAAGQIEIYDKMAHGFVSMAGDSLRAAEVLEKIVVLDPAREITYRQLEELYAGLEKWIELVETYRSHVSAVDDPQAKIALLDLMGAAYERQLVDVDRAIETYAELLELDPQNYAAASNLSRLQEQIEDWPNAIDTMVRLADLTSDPGHRCELLTQIARVQHEKLYAAEEAEYRLNQALEVDPAYVPALVMLGDIYRSRGDWLKASRALESAAEHCTNLLEKTHLTADAAQINYEALDNRSKALDLFAQTLRLDPEHVRAGKVLVDSYYEDGRLADADPIFDMLTRKIEALELSDEEQVDLFLRAARTARATGQPDKALKQYKRAHDLDTTNYDVQSGMADLLFEQQDWDKAVKLYQTILVQHRETQSDDDIVGVYFRLGSIKQSQGEPRKALNYLEKALEINPHHEATLNSVVALQTAANNWEEVIAAKRSLVEMSPNGETQFALWKDIGELYLDKLSNKDKAATAFSAALEIKPDDRALLQQMLDLYQSARRWTEVIDIIDRVVELESDPKRRSLYHYTVGVLLRDELGRTEEAVDRFDMVLDDDPSMLKAFQAIDTILTRAKDWKQLERSYRKMLKRLPPEGNEALRITLWGNLGEIYRTRLQDFKAAAAAFEVAAKLDPENVDRHVKLAELYDRLIETDPAQFLDAAVREHQILIANEPFRYESYHALFGIYSAAEQTDKAFCIASVLSFLKKASDEENRFVERYRRSDFVMARQRLSEETLRRHVFHPDEDLYLTGILALIAPAMAAMRAVPMPSTFSADERIDIQVDPTLFSRMAKYVKDVLNVATPDAYFRPADPGDLVVMNVKRDDTVHPTIVAFQNVLRAKSEAQLAFALGRHMSDLYLPHYCYVVLERSPQNLKQAVLACLRAVGMPVPGDAAGLEVLARNITGRMAPAAVDQLRSLLQKFVEAGGSTDVKRWAAAAELTAYRVGLLLCNDLHVAAHMISREQAVLGSTMGPRDKIKELVLYSISEDYFAARQALGLTVD